MTTPQKKAKKQPKAAKARSGGKPTTAGTKEQPTSDSAKLTKSATKKKKKPATGKGKKAPASSSAASSKTAKKRPSPQKKRQAPAGQPSKKSAKDTRAKPGRKKKGKPLAQASTSQNDKATCRRAAQLIEQGRFWEALGLPENAPPGQVMAALARLRSRCKELGERINALRFWLVDRRGRPLLERASRFLGAPSRKLLRAYGPELRPLLEQRAFEFLDAMRKGVMTNGNSDFDEVAERAVADMASGLSRLRVDKEDERRGFTIGVKHDSDCPVCNGTDKVPCPVCKGEGRKKGKIDAVELARYVESNEQLAAAVRDAMKKQKIPSWVTPAEFVEIGGMGAEGEWTCPACNGEGTVPCPNKEDVQFNLPKGFQDGWIAKSASPGQDGKYYFVTLQRA